VQRLGDLDAARTKEIRQTIFNRVYNGSLPQTKHFVQHIQPEGGAGTGRYRAVVLVADTPAARQALVDKLALQSEQGFGRRAQILAVVVLAAVIVVLYLFLSRVGRGRSAA
jgi:hypothetical protein